MTRIFTIAKTVWLEMLRRKDLYVLCILLAAMLLFLVSVDVFGISGIKRYVVDVGLLLAWVFGWILAVNVSTRQLPREEHQGTIFSLLAKPISRAELIVGKWLGAWTLTGGALTSFYLALALVTLLRGGTLDAAAYTQAWLLHLMALAIVTSMGFLLSARMHQDAAAALTFVLSGGAFLMLPNVPQLMADGEGVSTVVMMSFYYAMPHFECFDMRQRIVHEWGAADGRIVLGVAVYGAVWTVLLLLLAWLAYRRKHFARDAVG